MLDDAAGKYFRTFIQRPNDTVIPWQRQSSYDYCVSGTDRGWEETVAKDEPAKVKDWRIPQSAGRWLKGIYGRREVYPSGRVITVASPK